MPRVKLEMERDRQADGPAEQEGAALPPPVLGGTAGDAGAERPTAELAGAGDDWESLGTAKLRRGARTESAGRFGQWAAPGEGEANGEAEPPKVEYGWQDEPEDDPAPRRDQDAR